MRFILRIMILPVILMLNLMKLLLACATKIYCLVAGMAINILLVCIILAIISKQWLALEIFGVLFVVLAILFFAGSVTVLVDSMKERLLEVEIWDSREKKITKKLIWRNCELWWKQFKRDISVWLKDGCCILWAGHSFDKLVKDSGARRDMEGRILVNVQVLNQYIEDMFG